MAERQESTHFLKANIPGFEDVATTGVDDDPDDLGLRTVDGPLHVLLELFGLNTVIAADVAVEFDFDLFLVGCLVNRDPDLGFPRTVGEILEGFAKFVSGVVG